MGHQAIILAAVLVFAAPGLAAPAPVQSADTTSGTAASTGGNSAAANASANPARPVKYCVEVEPPTGSLLKMTECKTREQWAKEGVDVDQLTKN